MQELQPFALKLRGQIETRDVASWLGEAHREAGRDRIFTGESHHDRDRVGGLPSGPDRVDAYGEDGIRFGCNELTGEFTE